MKNSSPADPKYCIKQYTNTKEGLCCFVIYNFEYLNYLNKKLIKFSKDLLYPNERG